MSERVLCRIRLFPTLISKTAWLSTELPLTFILDEAFLDKYEELTALANENGIIKKVLKAGANHFAVGPDFGEVGDSNNYQFQDCSDIAKNSRYNTKVRTYIAQFADGMENGIYDENLIFPPSGLGQLVVKCFYPSKSVISRQFNHFKLNGEFGGWTIIAKGSGTSPLVPIQDASTEQQGHIFGSSDDHYWIGFHNALYLTSLYSHKEKTALKINIKIRSQELR